MNMKSIKYFILALSLITLLTLESCSYSFTGASVPAHLQTVAIPTFDDRSGSGEPILGEKLTTELTNKFITDNSLQITNKTDADAIVEGKIERLSDTPEAIDGGETISLRKITIRVKVLYKDLVKRQNIFDKSFTSYATYNNETDYITARQSAIDEAIEQIAEDILLAVVSNW